MPCYRSQEPIYFVKVIVLKFFKHVTGYNLKQFLNNDNIAFKKLYNRLFIFTQLIEIDILLGSNNYFFQIPLKNINVDFYHIKIFLTWNVHLNIKLKKSEPHHFLKVEYF